MREEFEKVFPVPEGVEWNELVKAYCWKNTRTLCAYDDWWGVWQESKKIRFRSPTCKEGADSDSAYYRLVENLNGAPLPPYDAFRYGYMQAWQAATSRQAERVRELEEALKLCYDHSRLWHRGVETNNVGSVVRKALSATAREPS
jgi:hypothetical protein